MAIADGILMWPLAHFARVTIDHTQAGSADSSQFTVVVNITNTKFKTIANGGQVRYSTGNDIRFSSNLAGTSLLSWEKEKYDPVTGNIIFWVLLSSVSHTVDTVFYMNWGNPANSTFAGGVTGAAWNSNFGAVYHLPDGTTLSAADSTTNANNGTISGTVSAVAGEIDGGASIANGSNIITIADSTSLRTTSVVSISGWVNIPAFNSNYGLLFSKRDASNPAIDYNYSLWVDPTGKLFCQFLDGSYKSATSSGAISTSTWTHIAGIINSNDLFYFYINGVLDSTVSNSGNFMRTSTPPAQLGNYNVAGGIFSLGGSFDEVHINMSQLTADWYIKEVNNQKAGSTFISITFL